MPEHGNDRTTRADELAQEIGRALREARLARGEDLAQVARDRFIPAGYLAALERGAFEEVPGLPYRVAIVRAYGNHLGLDGAKLADPLQAALAVYTPPGPEPLRRAGGSRYRAAVAVAAWLLLTAAAGAAYYYAFHRLDPAAVEAVAGAAPAVADPPSPGETRRTDDALPAAPAPAGAPGSEAAASAAVPSGSEPSAATNRAAAVPATAEIASVPRAEPSSNGPAASVGEPHAPGSSDDPTPDAAAAAGGPPASGGDRTEVARPTTPVPVGPGPISPSPETTIGTVEEPVAAVEPAAVSPARTAGAPPAGRFAIYFFSVRPPARVASEWRRLVERHPDALAGLEPWAPRPVEVPGKGTFYRVEAGAFATEAEAQAVCDRLRSRGQSCRALTR